jgi:outer membrane protein TolC
MQLHAAADQGRPQLDVTLQATRNQVANSLRSAFGAQGFEVSTFAGVSIPFDRAPSTAARHAAAIELDRRRRQLADLRLRIAQEVRTAHRNQARLKITVEQADLAVGFAEQELELAALRYQRGLSNNLDVVAAESSLLGARARRFASIVDLALARLRLRAAIGLLDVTADFE